jgi:hypothetical protein
LGICGPLLAKTVGVLWWERQRQRCNLWITIPAPIGCCGLAVGTW